MPGVPRSLLSSAAATAPTAITATSAIHSALREPRFWQSGQLMLSVSSTQLHHQQPALCSSFLARLRAPSDSESIPHWTARIRAGLPEQSIRAVHGSAPQLGTALPPLPQESLCAASPTSPQASSSVVRRPSSVARRSSLVAEGDRRRRKEKSAATFLVAALKESKTAQPWGVLSPTNHRRWAPQYPFGLPGRAGVHSQDRGRSLDR